MSTLYFLFFFHFSLLSLKIISSLLLQSVPQNVRQEEAAERQFLPNKAAISCRSWCIFNVFFRNIGNGKGGNLLPLFANCLVNVNFMFPFFLSFLSFAFERAQQSVKPWRALGIALHDGHQDVASLPHPRSSPKLLQRQPH
jgi:hypothetical protein